MKEKKIKIKDLAKRLGRSERTIRNYIKSGMPSFKIGGTLYFYESKVNIYFENKN